MFYIHVCLGCFIIVINSTSHYYYDIVGLEDEEMHIYNRTENISSLRSLDNYKTKMLRQQFLPLSTSQNV